jgi:hypothetical protein
MRFKVNNVLARNIPWLLGGSAGLGRLNKTQLTYERAEDMQGRHSRNFSAELGSSQRGSWRPQKSC